MQPVLPWTGRFGTKARLGLDEKNYMEIGGWKTSNVFNRYNIMDENDLAEVAAALDRKRQADQSPLNHNP